LYGSKQICKCEFAIFIKLAKSAKTTKYFSLRLQLMLMRLACSNNQGENIYEEITICAGYILPSIQLASVCTGRLA
jgi:hypothetical protein